jgi:hypothetical protein
MNLWRIRGFDGLKMIFETKVGIGQFTDQGIQDLLRALTARSALTFDEIIGSFARRGTKIANDLAVRKDLDSSTFTCGSNPFFTASIVDENGSVVKHRPIDE